MTKRVQTFLSQSEAKAFDKQHKHKLQFNITKYDQTVVRGKQQYADLEFVKKRAKNIKYKAIENLDRYLVEFETNFTANGGKVIWANDDKEALQEILKIVKAKKAKTAVKAKSMATEEIHLNEFLAEHGVRSVETDLGEFIQQLDGEPPYHIVTPAMHKSKDDVAKLFADKLGTDINLTAQELTLVAREKLRHEYVQADIGFSGANFILPDIGGIAVTENEGNARLSTSFPKTHIVVVGIEKMLTGFQDLAMFWPLLATYGTGQKVTVYNTVMTGPRKENEQDGPEEMYVILLDNGRSKLLADEVKREALYCIRCGACLNACPVYKNIGGHTYGTTYSGPIGSVITPHYKGMEEFSHLSFASSLCGNCTEVCPVRINLHNLLLYNRHESVQKGLTSMSEKTAWSLWRRAMLNRKTMERGGAGMKNMAMKVLFRNSWGKHRSMLHFAPKSFHERWMEMHPEK
ncbi:MAG: iron-sulfur cluster-binding protein [Chitinophagales bacterium]|nr:iron-sulfur cluster-binding protein [Chitinophagales bacterium]HAE12933.1 iron-sulfur cluster-binding protein [Bacteroidota bacterium]MCB9021187.1 iron-sulfur cluster-binding protein [Chitinophagales bacterium]MCB9032186.1 iron-sulfur cluster-binding protein [Chitinophagales bacterium]HAE35866.1 iron-sulfur cluster-binding protein [Bacteroidota bacterium]